MCVCAKEGGWGVLSHTRHVQKDVERKLNCYMKSLEKYSYVSILKENQDILHLHCIN